MERMVYRGRIWKYQDNVSTDHILPSRFMTQVEPAELAAHCMAGLDEDFAAGVREGDIFAAGYNLGYGSSREQAPRALLHAGIRVVVARTFARIFYRNCYNIGLPAVACPDFLDSVSDMDEVEVDLAGGLIRNLTLGDSCRFNPPPAFLLDYVRAGGLIPHLVSQSGT
jgi:3-isopropylmalate/(R)-2-methylmalate dehydratase small subunit